MSEPITTEQIQELREREAKSTQGKWEEGPNGIDVQRHPEVVRNSDGGEFGVLDYNDTLYIIALQNAAPTMLDEIERLRKVEAAARELDLASVGGCSCEECKAKREIRAALENK